MGLVENATKRADWDFALLWDDGGVDNIDKANRLKTPFDLTEI